MSCKSESDQTEIKWMVIKNPIQLHSAILPMIAVINKHVSVHVRCMYCIYQIPQCGHMAVGK